jgi:glycosyltransferase involved in cell wall biosynthesis
VPRTFIQVFNRYLLPGGEETSVGRIAEHLEKAGNRVIRFWRASDEWSRAAAPARWKQPLLMWRNNAVLDELRKLHEEVKPSAWILHNVLPVVSLGVYSLARELGVPVIQWLHNYRPLSPSGALRARGKMLQPEDRWLLWKETLAGSWRGRLQTGWLSLGYTQARRRGDFESVAAWIAVSDEMRRIFERGRFPRERLFTLRHSWDIKEQASARDDGYFLFLGRMVEEKGVRFLIDLWNQPGLKEVPLVMAGEGPLVEELRTTSPSSVKWAGYVKGEEKRALVGGCRAVLFPCLWEEPLSTVAYEAYEQSKPVLSSAMGGMKELVRDGETGRLLPPANAEAWIAAIKTVLSDPEAANRMGRNGRKWLTENVSAEAWASQFEEICRKALGR